MRINPEETMALVVDFQERLLPVISKKEEIIKNSKILLKGLTALKIPIAVTEQYPRGLGKTTEKISEDLENFTPLEKITFSCYKDEGIKKAVDSLNRKNVILIGTEAHICVLQTLVDLSANGYNVYLVEDCIGSRRERDKEIALRRAEKEGAFLTTCESILFELLQKAGTAEFKLISSLIK